MLRAFFNYKIFTSSDILRAIMRKKQSFSNIDENGRAFITQEELNEFKEIALKEHGVHLTDEEAFEQGFALLNLFDHLIKQAIIKKRELRNEKNFAKISNL